MIEFSRVSKTYPNGQAALQEVSFRLPAGRMAFLTGPSGAGKSTLLKLIPQIERPSSGKVLIHGTDIGRLAGWRIPHLRRRIGLIFQDPHLLAELSVFDNIALPLRVQHYPREETARRVRAALDKVGLLDRERARPQELSGGEQQRVNIARALVAKPSIILADEPTGNLDPELAFEIMRLFTQFNAAGVTMLIATHALGLINQFDAPRLMLREGRLRMEEA
ncbi:cell division ATP-binding protein FtsE [Thiofaba sp. EF100]|jgi:cell division transport system ATP-binding protein|uniref:cell division ATP-binding protein FtsE n=1 Tax=Thiofaba sp. EF100 TaxID=3121274 RepID=UPI003221CFA9